MAIAPGAAHHGGVRRPNPVQWLWYAWGGRLPQRYREWVLHDVTTRTWMWRHMARAIVLTLTAVAVVFVPLILLVHVQVWLAIAAGVLGLLVSVYYSMSYAWESGDVRLTRYGYPGGYGSQVRQRMAEERDREMQARYQAAWRR
ncbi:MAG TPA: DUF5313 family protein [Pseudonocardiaceae bacterium]|nr:DUF5313 family protein [Pseudonocardiaceae bacterium]